MQTRSSKIMYVIAIFSMLASFILIILAKGLEDYSISGTFELKQIFKESLTSVTTWILNICIALSVTIFFFWSYTIKKDKLLSTDEWQQKVDNYNSCLKFKNKDFIKYVKDENNRRRIESYVNHIEKKIMRKEKKLSKMTWLDLKLKRDIAIERTIKRLQSKTTDEYIKTHLVYHYYNAVSPSDFQFNSITSDDVSDRTFSREGAKMTLTMTKKVIFSLVTSSIALSFLTSLLIEFKISPSFFIVLLSVVISLLINVWTGLGYATKVYTSEYVSVIENKTRLLKDYINWSKNNNNNDTYAEKVLDAYEKNIKTKEELKSLIEQTKNINLGG